MTYDSLQLREIFHLEFLRRLGMKLPVRSFALKGGANMRFFFGSPRYSEDIDLDVVHVEVSALKEAVMKILETQAFQNELKPFGIERLALPEMAKAKQTETTQRFKVHLLTGAGEDLFSKIEFSRRGFKGRARPEFVSETVLRGYGMSPLIVPHYDLASAILQKIEALATRPETQARDIFDLHALSTLGHGKDVSPLMPASRIETARERLFEVGYRQYLDTVVAYLSPEDRAIRASPEIWDETRLRVARFLEEVEKKHA